MEEGIKAYLYSILTDETKIYLVEWLEAVDNEIAEISENTIACMEKAANGVLCFDGMAFYVTSVALILNEI
jgi:hypothetical protein